MADEESSTTSEESLDAASDKFDPIKALYSPRMRLSLPNAPIYDNVTKFESVFYEKITKNVKKSEAANQGECSKRPVLSQHGATAEKDSSRREFTPRNVLTKMQRILGPLGILYGYMENRVRIKVYTRNARGIRGHVEAYVAAFDKHWNLALEDCFEVWTRKVKRKAPAALGIPRPVLEEEGKEKEKQAEDVFPKVVVTRTEGNRETLERHVPQMLLRGEQVAIIVKIN